MDVLNRNIDHQTNSQKSQGAVDTQGRFVITEADGDVFKLIVPPIAVGANKVFMDLFNGTTDRILQLISARPVVDGSVAVVGTLAVNLYLTRTTAVGTGGTAATAENTNLANPSVNSIDNRIALPAGVTARSAPTGGATAGAVLGMRSVFSEETNTASFNTYEFIESGVILVPANSGIRVVQGAVASVGNIGLELLFSTRRV